MPIPSTYVSITVGLVEYDLTHLNAFYAAIPGKGIVEGSDLTVTVVFSTHVFTERTKHGESHDVVDHHGTKRTFDEDRYEMSRELGGRINAKIKANGLTYVSQSFGGIDNLIFIEMADGRTWTIVYCLEPVGEDQVRMEVLSAHPKIINQRKISRKPLSYFARKCLFEGKRIPEND